MTFPFRRRPANATDTGAVNEGKQYVLIPPYQVRLN